jgi:hypothetical protein
MSSSPVLHATFKTNETDHEMFIDGIKLREVITRSSFDDGVDSTREITLHVRAIGDKRIEVREERENGVVREEVNNINLEREENVEQFESDWKKLWKPSEANKVDKGAIETDKKGIEDKTENGKEELDL